MNAFNGLTHLAIGGIMGTFGAHNNIEFGALMLGSLLPDIDTKQSRLGRYNPLVRFMKHRGHCHTIGGILLLALPFLLFGVRCYVISIVGALSHLLGDRLGSLKSKRRFTLRWW